MVLRPRFRFRLRVVSSAAAGLASAVALTGAAGAQAAVWSLGTPMTGARYLHTATTLPSGKLLVAGGFGNNFSFLSSAELYDPATGQWSSAGDMGTARDGQIAIVLGSGDVLVAGGNGPRASAELYDPAANRWRATDSMTQARFAPTATLLKDGRVLVAGGSGGEDFVPLRGAEVYDPAAGSWSAVAPMGTPRASHTATLLDDGRVLVAGGYDGTKELAGAEIYDPAANSWSPAEPLRDAREAATATKLQDGKVLVAGGDAGTGEANHALKSAEIYDPATRHWLAANDMQTARTDADAALRGDGSVLVAGGDDARLGTALASTEIYHPDSDVWSSAGDFGARGRFALATIGDDVLATGGNGGGFGTAMRSTELFGTAPTAPATGGTTTGTGTSQAGTAGSTGSTARTGTTSATGSTAPSAGSDTTSARPVTANDTAVRARCNVQTTKPNGRARSTVVCRVSYPSKTATRLRASLLRHRAVLSRSTAIARNGLAVMRLRRNQTLAAGGYVVVITRRDGSRVLRQAITTRSEVNR